MRLFRNRLYLTQHVEVRKQWILIVIKMSPRSDHIVLLLLIVPAYAMAVQGVADFIRAPPDKCLIPFDDFKDKVAGNNYTSAYVMTAGQVGGGGVPRPQDLGQRSDIRWRITSDGRIRRSTGFWSLIRQACFTIDEFWPQRVCDGASFVPIGSSVDLAVPVPRFEVLISCDPENYVVRVFCDGEKLVPGSQCSNGAAMIFIRDRREDNDGDGLFDENPDYSGTDWYKIDRLIRACLGTKLVEWQWHPLRREECPRPQ